MRWDFFDLGQWKYGNGVGVGFWWMGTSEWHIMRMRTGYVDAMRWMGYCCGVVIVDSIHEYNEVGA